MDRERQNKSDSPTNVNVTSQKEAGEFLTRLKKPATDMIFVTSSTSSASVKYFLDLKEV